MPAFHVQTRRRQTALTPWRNFRLSASFSKKNAADEILDALDTLLGVSPLSETDLLQTNSDADLEQRAAERERAAPPDDALNKTSVKLFFFLLGLFPVVSLFAAVKWGGVKPFGL